jgi:hypothetical protein
MSAVEPVPPPTPPSSLADASSSMEKGTDKIGASALRKASVRLIPLIAIAYGRVAQPYISSLRRAPSFVFSKGGGLDC